MEQLRAWSSTQTDLGKKIVLAACVIVALMVLFPPKVVVTRNPLLDQTRTESVGYHFIFDDPSAEQKKDARILLGDKVDEYINSQIEWGKLFLQLVVIGGVAFFLVHITKPGHA